MKGLEEVQGRQGDRQNKDEQTELYGEDRRLT